MLQLRHSGRLVRHPVTQCTALQRLPSVSFFGCRQRPLREPASRRGRVHAQDEQQSPSGRDENDRPGPSEPQPPSEPTSSTPSTSSSSSSEVSTSTSAGIATADFGALEGENQPLQIPKAVVERLKFSVFGYDTMWVTAVDNYGADGVVFKGNVRAKDPAAAYTKLKERLKAELGDDWQIFLVEDKDEQPTAVILPSSAREGTLSRTTEVWLAVVFALLSGVASLNSAGAPLIQFLVDPFHTDLLWQDIQDALPIAGTFWFLLGAHEWGHQSAAARRNISLYLPLIVPAGFGFVGSFGGITRFKGFCTDRETLLDVAASGPAVGYAASAAVTLLGLSLSAAGLGDVTIDTPAFTDSLGMALLGQVFLGDALAQPEVQVSSLLVAGWAGLVVNALNTLPVGELDGGRMALALFGRRASTALSVLTTAALAISSFNNSLAFYWVLFVLVLQRGPILPCQQELAPPSDSTNKRLATAMLFAPLLVLLPYPEELVNAFQSMRDPLPF